jgi:hypothetical protein
MQVPTRFSEALFSPTCESPACTARFFPESETTAPEYLTLRPRNSLAEIATCSTPEAGSPACFTPKFHFRFRHLAHCDGISESDLIQTCPHRSHRQHAVTTELMVTTYRQPTHLSRVILQRNGDNVTDAPDTCPPGFTWESSLSLRAVPRTDN